MADAAFTRALVRIGFPAAVARALIAQGIDGTNGLSFMEAGDIKQVVKSLRQDGQVLPVLSIVRLQTMRYWVQKRLRLGLSIDPEEFTLAVAAEWYAKMKAETDESSLEIVVAPEKFKKDTKWREFRDSFITYLQGKKGRDGMPLAYVIRDHDEPRPEVAYPDEHARTIGILPLTGPAFVLDNGVVFDCLKSYILAGPAWTWIQQFDRSRNGRAAWKALIEHYEGPSTQNRIKNAAYASISKARYDGERKNFTFENYFAIHQKAHLDLETFGEPVPETRKTRDFLNGIHDPKAAAAKATALAMPNLLADFTALANYIASALDIQLTLTSSERNISDIHRSNSGRGTFGGRGRGRGGGRGGRGGNRAGRGGGRFSGRIPWKEWRKMSQEERDNAIAARDKPSEDRKRNVGAVSAEQDDAERPSKSKRVTWADTEEAGDHMSRRKKPSWIVAVKTSNRRNDGGSSNSHPDSRVISQSQTTIKEETIKGRTDLDSHADTCCAGATTVVIEYTGKTCDVSPFSQAYDATKDVPIVKAVTAYDDPSTGETFILVMNQALYFGDQMENSLLCPNQMRAHGVVVDDVPIHLSKGDSTHSIFFPSEKVRIPLDMHGCISYIPTRTPTKNEIETCLWLELTSQVDWDPYDSAFKDQEDQAKNQDDYLDRNVCQVLSSVSRALSEECVYQDVIAQDGRQVAAVTSSGQKSSINKEDLARRWGIGLDSAALTLKVTTQKGVRCAIHPLERRYRTKQSQLRYNQLGTQHGRFATDTMFASVKSVLGNTMGQIFVNDVSFTRFIPMKAKSEAGDALVEFIQDVGIPSALHSDDAKELTLGKWQKVRQEFSIKQTQTEPHSPWQNRAEGAIRELKRHVQRLMKRQRAPRRLWDFCAVYVSEIRTLTASPLFSLHGRTPYELVTGNTPDISEYVEYEWYQPIWYLDSGSFPEEKLLIGRWLGVAHRIGQAMCYWVLPQSGVPIARTTIKAISGDELATDAVCKQLETFDEGISSRIGDHMLDPDVPEAGLDAAISVSDVDEGAEYEPMDPEAVPMEADDYDEETLDKLLSAEVLVPKGDGFMMGTVVSRKRDADGNPIGKANSNPILDTRVYEVQFPDGHLEEYSANVIAESMYSQVDDEGNQFLLLQEIVDHRKDSQALSKDDMYVQGTNGNRHLKKTTKGWKLCVAWKDGSTSWEPLKNLKESHPVQVAEYAVNNQLVEEPAFAWWVKDVLRRKDRIISAVKSRYWKRTHKFGIRVPKSIQEALDIDRETGTTHWHDAIQKEMKNVMPAFKFLEPEESVPVGYKWIPCHMIFDVKMDFTRKARFVAGGHVTDPPTTLTYSSVVSRDSIRIAFLIAALNDIDILAADVGNAYLNAPTREKVYSTAGKEFGSKAGSTIIIVRALYGLKSSGAAWRSHLAETLHGMNFTSSLADPDVWYRAAVKPDSGFKYYEYVLIYVDDILALSHRPQDIMKTLGGLYRLKENSVERPKRYLGATIKEWRFPEDTTKVRWGMSSEQYVQEAIRTVELELSKVGRTLKNKASTPLTSGYRPELDVSPLLDEDGANYYMNLIGILRWAVELGRIDIHVDVALLASFLMQPRKGHLEQVFHIFAYLKQHKRSTMVFDDTPVDWDESAFQKHEWTDFYKDAKEAIPLNAPEPRGNAVQINCFVDADHAGNRVTRRSHTGVLIFVNRAPILWFSKAQNTVETSTFGSEFVAMRIATELIEGLRYKLRMFGIPLDGPANVFCDNQSVVLNTTLPSSTLKKKHNAIAYHRVREAVAAETIRIAKVSSEKNVADLLTKPLPGPKLHAFAQMILY